MFLAVSGGMRAQGLVLTLVGPAESVAPGAEVSVGLLAVNSTEVEGNFAPPLVMHGQLWRGDRSWPVALTSVPGNAATVLPGAFNSRAYTFTLPAGVSGRLILEASDGLTAPVRAVLAVGSPPGAAPAVPTVPEQTAPAPAAASSIASPLAAATSTVPPATVAPTPAGNDTAIAGLQRSFLDHFGQLDPIYFIYGPKAPAVKFQFSLMYRFFSFDGPEAHDAPEKTLQFGYTQRSLWDITASSSPFYDTSYMPSLFYQFLAPAPRPENAGGITWLGFQSGYQHESNGQAGTLSRTINSLFVRTGVLVGRADRWHAVLQLRGFDYVGGLSDNPAMKDYRGYSTGGVTIGRGDGPSLAYNGWMGQHFNHVTSQYDLTFPVKTHVLDFATYLLIQYFDGYGESLRAYEQHSDTVRAGISLAR